MRKTVWLFVVVCAALVSAQSKHDAFDAEMASVIILQSKPVQAELKISQAQRNSMNKYADAHRADMEKYQKELESKHIDKTKPLPVDPKRVDALFVKMKNAVLNQLSKTQVRRLREISLQQLGFVALTDATVAKKVGLSAAERKKLQTAYDAGLKEADEIAKGAQAQLDLQLQELRKRKPKNEKEEKALMEEAQKKAEQMEKRIDPQIEKVRIATRTKVLKMLTAKQKAAWDKLLGKPFKV